MILDHVTKILCLKEKMVNKIGETLKFLKGKFGYEFILYIWNLNLFNVIIIALITMIWGLPVQPIQTEFSDYKKNIYCWLHKHIFNQFPKIVETVQFYANFKVKLLIKLVSSAYNI